MGLVEIGWHTIPSWVTPGLDFSACKIIKDSALSFSLHVVVWAI